MSTKAKKQSPFPPIPHPAILTVWAALIAVAKMLPAIALVGSGGTLSVASALLPLCGVFFGPYAGAIVAAIGGFVGQLLSPSTAWLGIFTFLIGVACAFCTGMIIYKRWFVAAIVLAFGTIAQFCFPVGRKAWFFAATMYGTGLVCMLIAGIACRKGDWFNKGKELKKQWMRIIVVFTACVAGQMCSASLSGITQFTIFHMPLISFKVLMFSAPLERIGMALGSVVIGIPLLIALPKVGIMIGEVPSEEEEARIDAEAEKEFAEMDLNKKD